MVSGEDYTAQNELEDAYRKAFEAAKATTGKPLLTGGIVTAQLPRGMRKPTGEVK